MSPAPRPKSVNTGRCPDECAGLDWPVGMDEGSGTTLANSAGIGGVAP